MDSPHHRPSTRGSRCTRSTPGARRIPHHWRDRICKRGSENLARTADRMAGHRCVEVRQFSPLVHSLSSCIGSIRSNSFQKIAPQESLPLGEIFPNRGVKAARGAIKSRALKTAAGQGFLPNQTEARHSLGVRPRDEAQLSGRQRKRDALQSASLRSSARDVLRGRGATPGTSRALRILHQCRPCVL